MKLYATVSSERATKGQGGNDFIAIRLMCGSAKSQKQAGFIEMRLMNDEKYCQVSFQDPNNEKVIICTIIPMDEAKGERQKGEPTGICASCGRDTYGITCEHCFPLK